jgi:hypothetical protein
MAEGGIPSLFANINHAEPDFDIAVDGLNIQHPAQAVLHNPVSEMRQQVVTD